MLKRILLIIVLSIPFLGLAQDDVMFKMSIPKLVSMQEQFRLSISINEDVRPQLPPLDDFEIIYGPSLSKSSSVQIINGKRTAEKKFVYTYVLRPLKEGNFTIQPATASINGVEYKSNTGQVQVVRELAKPNTQQENSANQQVSKNSLFARIYLSNANPYKGEQVVATIRLYVSPNLNLAGLNDVKMPSFAGFYTQEINSDRQLSFEREAYDNQIYNVATIKKYIIYPQQLGEIKIDPFEIECLLQKRVGSTNRGFFGGVFDQYVTEATPIKSNSPKIKVKELPTSPSSYYGAVGDMKMTASVNKTEAKANEAITLKLTVNGKGNLRLIDVPEVKFPEDFEVYDPKKTEKLKNTEAGQQGTVTLEYIIIPRYAGTYTIPPVEFSCFNPKTKTYNTSKTNSFELVIEKGDEQAATIISGAGGYSNKEDIRQIGQDIRYIMQGKYKLEEPNVHFYNSSLFWLIYIVSLLIFATFTIVYRKQLKESEDVVLSKHKKANKVAKTRLKAASKYLKEHNKEEFYEAILKAFWGYLSDKLSMPISELNRNNATISLAQRSVSEECCKEFIEIIDACEFARYAPSSSDHALEELYSKSVDLMGKLEKQIR